MLINHVNKKVFYYIDLIVFVLSSLFSNTSGLRNIFVDFEKDSKNIAAFTKVKDGGGISLGVYREGFDSKILRDSVLANNNTSRRLEVVWYIEPSFVNNYVSFKKAESLISLENIDYVSVDDYRKNELKYFCRF